MIRLNIVILGGLAGMFYQFANSIRNELSATSIPSYSQESAGRINALPAAAGRGS